MDGRPLTIKEAARHFGVSERTIRRRIAAGELQARRVPMAQGYQVFVYLDDNLETDPVQVDTRSVQYADHLDSGTSEALIKALELIERLHRENQEIGARATWLEAQLQQAQDQIRFLTVKREAKEETPAAEPTPEQPSEPRSALWQWVRRKLSRT